MAKKLYETKDAKEKSEFVEEIKNGLSNLKDETPDQILETVNEILDFNKEIKKKQGLGLKILTPDQMLDYQFL